MGKRAQKREVRRSRECSTWGQSGPRFGGGWPRRRGGKPGRRWAQRRKAMLRALSFNPWEDFKRRWRALDAEMWR